MNFKKWLISEEIYPQNKTATVYHRTETENVPTLLKTDFRVGKGCLYGCGLYTTFSIDSQFSKYMDQYGESVVKFKATNLDDYLIVHKSVAKQLLGEEYKVSDQIKKFGLESKFKPEDLERYDDLQEKSKYSSLVLQFMYAEYPLVLESLKGAIYYGANDGYCLLKYPPIEDGTITMLGFAQAPANDLNKKNELENNIGWTKSTPTMSIKDLRKLPADRRSQEMIDFYDIEEDRDFIKYLKNNQVVPDEDHLVTKISAPDRVVPYMSKDLLEKLVNDGYVGRILENSIVPNKVLQIFLNKINPTHVLKLTKQIIRFADDAMPILNQMMQGFEENIPDSFIEDLLWWSKPKNTEATNNLILNSNYQLNGKQAKKILERTPAEKQPETLKYLLKKYNMSQSDRQVLASGMRDKKEGERIISDLYGAPATSLGEIDD